MEGPAVLSPSTRQLPPESNPLPLSSRPERTRISYFALLATTSCAALRKESRKQFISATGLNRKSGGAQWRDLQCALRFSKSFRVSDPDEPPQRQTRIASGSNGF